MIANIYPVEFMLLIIIMIKMSSQELGFQGLDMTLFPKRLDTACSPVNRL